MMNIKRFLFATFAAALTLTACFAKPQSKVSLANNVGELSWSSNYTVDAQKFEGASEGSVISIDARQTKADYHKFKLYSMGNGWKELGSGGVTGASFANGEISVEKSSCTISIKLTNQEAEELKKGGMVLHGFGLSIKKMELTASAQKQNGKHEKSPKHEKPGKQEKSAKTANANLPFDLGNWKSIVLPAESIKSSGNFSIKISTKASNAEKNPSYFNIKLYVPENSSWTPLGKGNLEPAQNGVKLQGDLIVLPKADNTFVYTPTNSERNAIKKNGLVVQGYGMSVTEVNSVTVAELHSKPEPKKAEPKKPDAKKPEAKKPEPLPSKKDKESPAVSPVTSAKGTPFANHGKLHVTGTNLCDSKNQPYQLYGMSTHGLSWYPEYVSKESFTSLRDDWNTNCVRLVLYPGDYMGYCNGGNKTQLKNTVYKGIEEATALGMYVI
ncbi:MAG: cellulase family glycosylhydrolase, partial [Treponema sp.]|nr:cellulase family glycosylhydrolase [Treponema sp.]